MVNHMNSLSFFNIKSPKCKLQTIFFLIIAGCNPENVSTEAITKNNQNERAISVLNNLIQVDIDTHHTYIQAIKALKSQYAIKILCGFRDEHYQHIKALSNMVTAIGGIPPTFSRDFKGYVISGYTTIKTQGSDRSILKAMASNELLSAKYHNDALKVDLPGDVRIIIQKHLKEEEKHLEGIRTLKHKV